MCQCKNEPSSTQQTAQAAGTFVFLLLFYLCSLETLCEAEDVDVGAAAGAAQVKKIPKPVKIPQGETQSSPALSYSVSLDCPAFSQEEELQ